MISPFSFLPFSFPLLVLFMMRSYSQFWVQLSIMFLFVSYIVVVNSTRVFVNTLAVPYIDAAQ